MPVAWAQSVTGQISGTVTDASGGTVIGATAVLTHDLSKTERSYTTSGTGAFVFTGLVPGTYSLNITMAGFKAYEQKAITVAAQERVDLHESRAVGRRCDQHGRSGGQRRARGHR